jgi:Tol biopolymer transport system component
MSTEDPLDELSRSISDGDSVDWDLAESGTLDASQRESVTALRYVERIAEVHRALHRPRSPDSATGTKAGRSHWGDLTLLELARTGASGEVWRAWDVWLQREVALKFLQVSGSLSAGLGESALLDEARALARVRHPGVVAVHGIAEHEGKVGMWMEFLEGTTLAAEIERSGALPPLEVARIGLDLCRALMAVESAGVVHGDIKPANVVLETTGRVVLTDFGLGRRWELADPEWRTSGTPLFMSPGVLSGQAATPRSDIYSLGVTLRWALTGRSPFGARSFEELKVEAKSGPSTALGAERPEAPPALIAAIERAMAPDSEARYPGASQMADDLELVLAHADERGVRRRWLPAAAVAIASLAVLGIAALLVRSFERRTTPSPTSFAVTAPFNTTLEAEPSNSAISPDGRLLAFVAFDSSRTERLWLRPMKSLSARPIEGTEGGQGPFWSPDSRNLGFFADAKLKRVSIAGGAPEVLCAAPDSRGGSWGRSGVIVFAPAAGGPLCRISAAGGPVAVIARPDSAKGETALRWPEFLPDGKRFLYVALPPRADGNFDVYVSSIDSKERKLALRSGAAPVVAGSDELLLVSGGRLMAQRVDFATMKRAGEPVSLGPATVSDISVGERLASASMNGVLAQPSAAFANTDLLWLDRQGHEQGACPAPTGRYERLRFSPDGRRLLVIRRGSVSAVDLWMITLTNGLATRLTAQSQSRVGGRPCWSPDGSRVAFSSNRNGPTNIYQKVVDAAEDEELIYQSTGPFKEVDAWSPDGRYLLFEQIDPIGAWNLWLLPLQGERKPVPYAHSSSGTVAGSISPDGRWAAYSSPEGGKTQVYVQSFPQSGERFLVAGEPGDEPQWSRDGKELVFGGLDGSIWAVPVVTSPTFKAGAAHRLFRLRGDVVQWAVTPDHRRFVVSVPAADVPPATITVLLNWPAALEE